MFNYIFEELIINSTKASECLWSFKNKPEMMEEEEEWGYSVNSIGNLDNRL